MCGIFGVLDNKSEVDIFKLRKISELLSHRGPDDEGYFLASSNAGDQNYYKGEVSSASLNLNNISNAVGSINLALLHRRLSIIDLTDSGHQPMNYADRFTIILNGEIYNYLEIKNELKAKGYTFKSESDTEVVLAAFMEWGNDCMKRFNGMWAFAIWDRKENKLLLSRDRFGVKPLYYYNKNGVFIFCSEIKGIRAYLGNNISIRPKAIAKFLEIGEYTVGEDDETMFCDIKQLLPGHNIIIRNTSINIINYWKLNIKEGKNSLEKNIEEFKELFYDSIKLRLRSDVEVGSCLSGGIDSSSIVSFTSSKFNKRLHTFSIIWPGEKCDESKFVAFVNNRHNCYAHAFRPELENVLDIIDKVTWYQELPLATGSLIAQWFVMREAKKEGIKVLLDGQGADEVTAGYPRFIRSFLNEMILGLTFKQIIDNKNLLFQYGYSLRSLMSIFKSIMNYKLGYENERRFFTSLNSHLKYELEEYCLPTLLHYEDRNSMAHSVESRVPFLDYRLVEFLFSVSADQKIGKSRTKYILLESMKEYLPPEIYNRRNKIGFETPIEKYLKENEIYKNFNWLKDISINNYADKRHQNNISGFENKFKYYALSRFLTLYS